MTKDQRALLDQGFGKLASIALRAKHSPTKDTKHLRTLAKEAEDYARVLGETLDVLASAEGRDGDGND